MKPPSTLKITFGARKRKRSDITKGGWEKGTGVDRGEGFQIGRWGGGGQGGGLAHGVQQTRHSGIGGWETGGKGVGTLWDRISVFRGKRSVGCGKKPKRSHEKNELPARLPKKKKSQILLNSVYVQPFLGSERKGRRRISFVLWERF